MAGRTPTPLSEVLLATDFSPPASHALARVARLPLAKRARIRLLFVLDARIPRRDRREAETRARERLDAAGGRLRALLRESGDGPATVETELCAGKPYVEIIRRARRDAADLVVLGRHGERPLHDLFIGSTAERVARMGDAPILVVARPAARPYTRPLVALDLLDTSRRVLDLARRLTAGKERQLLVCHAFEVPFKGLVAYGVDDARRLSREARREALAACRSVCASIGEGVACKPVVVEGDARLVVHAEAERRRADLIVVGTHGRSGLSHVLIGSVAEWILRHASCDVAIARPARFSFARP